MFTTHLRFTETPGAHHAMDVSSGDTVGVVRQKAARELGVGEEDITLHHEGAPLDDLAQGVTSTALTEGDEVVAAPSKQYIAQRALREMGVKWKGKSLLTAVSGGRGEEEMMVVLRMLLDAGADAELVDECGQSPLHHAAGKGYVDVVLLLMEAGADVQASRCGWEPIHDAAEEGHLAVVQQLVRFGADLNVVDASGWTPVQYAYKKHHFEVVRYLIAAGASVKDTLMTSAMGGAHTLLTYASMCGHLPVVQALVDAGLDVTAVNGAGDTPLHVACKYGQLSVVRYLVGVADENSKNALGGPCCTAALDR